MSTLIAVNAIYPTYQGEVNIRGIGAPVIFLRLQGCHLRCYQSTLGTLCDTPEGLKANKSLERPLVDVVKEVVTLSVETGISLICLSGGDPLWRSPEVLRQLFNALTAVGLFVSVETSGTLSIAPYFDEDVQFPQQISWVIDFKSKSAGVKSKFIYNDLGLLSEKDFIKFVLYDDDDYKEFLDVLPIIRYKTKANIAVGPYWGGKLPFSKIFDYLRRDKLLKIVTMNTQLHKMTTFCELRQDELTGIDIPKLI